MIIKHLVMISADADSHLFLFLVIDHYIDLFMIIKHLVMISAAADRHLFSGVYSIKLAFHDH